MANRRACTCHESGSRSFDDFCEGYLLGLNHANCRQNTGMDAEQAFRAPNAFSTDSPEDDLAGGLFCADPDAFDGFDGGLSYDELEDAQAGNFLFEHPANAELPHTLANFMHPADAQADSLLFEQPGNAQLLLTPADLMDLVDTQEGSGIPANRHAPMFADPFFRHYVAHPDPLVPAQSRFFPTTANGFVGMRVEDLIFERPEPLNESCDLALSDAGDENTNHEQGNWGNEGEAAPHQRRQLTQYPAQPQLPPLAPEDHSTPCGREDCHICQVFSLPF